MAERRARAMWRGDLKSGGGTVRAASSGAYHDLDITWKARAEAANGKTSPEELLASAHAGCFSMALAGGLAKAGHPPDSLEVECTVTFDPVALKITKSALRVMGQVPGMDAASFSKAAEAAKDGCPVSRALSDDVTLELQAHLDEQAAQPTH